MATNTTTFAQVPTCYYALEPVPVYHAYFTIRFLNALCATITPIYLNPYCAEAPALPDMLVHLHAETADIPALIGHLHTGAKAWKGQPPVQLTFGCDEGHPLTGTDQFSRLYQLLRYCIEWDPRRGVRPSRVAVLLTWFFGLTAEELSLAQLRLHPRKLEVAEPAVEGAGAERGGEEIVAAKMEGAEAQHGSEEIVAAEAEGAGSQHGSEETVAAVPEAEGAGPEDGGEEIVAEVPERSFSPTIRRPKVLDFGIEPFPPPPNSAKARQASWDSGVDVTMPPGSMAELLEGSMPDCADEMVKRDLHRRYLAGAVVWTCVGKYPAEDEVAFCGGEDDSE
ncbi:hypothetical protein LTR12_014052 [Friedmanniomyces endolithicus]|nr:hypothetical protein LTR74_017007 [Friedmanniomyces endolithicus]KAK1811559.1 hypothetical protein LTR12_014052 [Friedmanniomyces endolithicus]